MPLGSRLQLTDCLTLRYQNQKQSTLTDVCDLIAQACRQITNDQVPSFVELLDAGQVLQMIYDNGNLTLDGDKGCGGLYELHTILDEIHEWFGNADSLANALHPFCNSNEEIADNIKNDGLSIPEVMALMQSICHYIPAECDVVGLPLVLVDTAV